MKYRILVNGTNTSFVKEFLGYKDNYFECLSTTDCISDLQKHFSIFRPHALLCFVERIYEGFIETLQELKEYEDFNDAAIIFVAKEEVLYELEARSLKGFADVFIHRPVTTANVILRMMNYLEDRTRKKFSSESSFSSDSVSAAEVNAASARPAVSEQPAASSQPAVPVQPTATERKKHILVVDDDRNVLKMVKAALEEKYDVTASANGVLVEKVLAAKPTDLIILDYEMPIMTGADVFRKLKDNPFHRNIPVCFLTGVSEQAKVREIMSLRPDSYLLKPIDMKMLMATIENLI